MPGAFDIVMDSRKELVNKIISMMESGYYFNSPEWDRSVFLPHNPLSKCIYKGGNRLRLMVASMEAGYTDSRWATLKQYKDKGYFPKKGEHGVLCEKWIFTCERTVVSEEGIKEKVIEELERPQVSYFRVFNALQIQGFPDYIKPKTVDTTVFGMADRLINTSECPVKEENQGRAYYSPGKDIIMLPPRVYFKDDISFVKTLLHEMGHSTGHPDRLNRDLSGTFGSPQYAKEELRAELGSLFCCTDLGLSLRGEHYEDHSDYLKSWIGDLKDDYNELFRACADAEKISQRIKQNYQREYELNPFMEEQIPDRTADKKIHGGKQPIRNPGL